MCNYGNVAAGLAFAIFTEFILFPFIILSVLYVIGKLPRATYALFLFVSGPVLLLFGIITLASLDGCADEVGSPDYGNRGSFALTTGIRALLLGLFLTALIFINKFVFKGTWTYGEAGEYTKPASSPGSTSTYHHTPSHTSTYTAQAPAQPQQQQPPQQTVYPATTATNTSAPAQTATMPPQHQAVPMQETTPGVHTQNPPPVPPPPPQQ